MSDRLYLVLAALSSGSITLVPEDRDWLLAISDDNARLRGTIERWQTARQTMMAGSAEGKPWSSQAIADLGLAEAALAAAVEKD